MQHRISYLRNHDDHFDLQQFAVGPASMRIKDLQAAKEHQVTLEHADLPDQLRKLLSHVKELHIRWSQSEPYELSAPISSRVSPGLHIFFTPRKDISEYLKGNESNLGTYLTCSVLKEIFSPSLKCDSIASTFTTFPARSSRHKDERTYQYHSLLSSLGTFKDYVQKTCGPSEKCTQIASLLSAVQSLEIDYESSTKPQLKIGGYSAKSRHTTTHSYHDARTEIGVLNPVAPDSHTPNELKLAGHLTVLSQDDKLKPAAFSFPSRHQPTPKSDNFAATFDTPTGTHPTLRLTFSGDVMKRPRPDCKLHTYLVLPSALFIDKYAFSDPLFLSSHGLEALRAISGATDLEAPDWHVKAWGSTALFELNPSSFTYDAKALTTTDMRIGINSRKLSATIPLHLRYLPPAAGGYTNISIPSPTAFWACPAPEEIQNLVLNPFDRRHLGWDGYFAERTIFWSLTPLVGEVGIRVPVLDTESFIVRSGLVEWGTVGAVGIGFLWCVWALLRPLFGRAADGKVDGEADGKVDGKVEGKKTQ